MSVQKASSRTRKLPAAAAPRRKGGKARSAASATKSAACAFYDLDGTLTDLNLVHSTVFFLANLAEWHRRLTYLMRFTARVPMLLLAEMRDRRLLNQEMFAVFEGISEDRLAVLGEEYCERVLMSHLYPRALELLKANQAAGREPILVTGSPDFLVAPLAKRLGIKEYVSNRLAFKAGLATGRLLEPIIAGEEKAQWCAEFAKRRGLNLRDCWGYADSYYDLAFLNCLGHPVAVNPDRELEAVARSRSWPVMRFEFGPDHKSESWWTSLTPPIPWLPLGAAESEPDLSKSANPK